MSILLAAIDPPSWRKYRDVYIKLASQRERSFLRDWVPSDIECQFYRSYYFGQHVDYHRSGLEESSRGMDMHGCSWGETGGLFFRIWVWSFLSKLAMSYLYVRGLCGTFLRSTRVSSGMSLFYRPQMHLLTGVSGHDWLSRLLIHVYSFGTRDTINVCVIRGLLHQIWLRRPTQEHREP
jgi:hypothetical protein